MIILFFILNQKSYFASLNFKHQQWEQENFSATPLVGELPEWLRSLVGGKLPEWLRSLVGGKLPEWLRSLVGGKLPEWLRSLVGGKLPEWLRSLVGGKLPEWLRSLVGEMFKYKCVFVARRKLQNLFCIYCFSRHDASTVMVESHVILVASSHNLDEGKTYRI